MPSTIIATGSKTIIDLSDGKSMSSYLGANLPKVQVKDVNASPVTYTPDWSGNTHLVVTPVVYVNNEFIALNNSALSTVWKRRDASGTESSLTTGESVSGNVLTVSQNVLASASGGLITYVCTASYLDPDTSLTITAKAEIDFALVTTGTNGTSAKTCSIIGEQAFKYNAAGTSVTPSTITLEAVISNCTISKWQYQNGSNWVDYPTSTSNPTITTSTLVVSPTDASFLSGDKAVIRVTTNDNNIYDVISIFKVHDGQSGGAGQNASVAFMSNENITFTADKDGKCAAQSFTCNVVAYTGTSKTTPTIGSVTGAPTGMSVSVGSASSNEIPLTISVSANATLGGAGQQSGQLSVPVSAPVSTTLKINWSKVNQGATGSNGTNAVVFSVYAPDGEVFTNHSGTLTLATAAYDGATAISSGASYQWQQYSSGSWSDISGATSSTYQVSGSSVQGTASFKCQMTYGGKTYSDVITLQDKTDNYQATIDSTAGDVFKNTIGTTCLICRVWQNAEEVDPLKSTTYSTTAPSSPSTGDFYYQITTSTPVTKLMRYNDSSWADVTSDATYKHTLTYTWYRRDKDGEPLDSGAAFATGKVIYVDGDDVDVKTVFVCEVS